jgi:hypothetical protein
MRSISVKMWAKFPVYGDIFIAPEALTIWAEYAIYGGIDKIPQICSIWAPMWSKMDYGGVKWRAQLHVYLTIYISVVIDQELVVSIILDHL